MTIDRRTLERMRALCGAVHEDDGVDPRAYSRPSRTQDKENRKAKQLCRQVAETLALVLGGETNDEILQCLQVASVVPAPDSSRLLVTLCADVNHDQYDCDAIRARLETHQGRLRCEVAAAITRRKTPLLVYDLIGFDVIEEGRP